MVPGARAEAKRRSRLGQASVELVALLPALALCVALAVQAVAAGWALWTAGNAARAGARAEHVGADGEAVARRA
ncbi:MAG: TadE family type IV pilus minor pilin, partial [Solirubrobacterales bacterium]